MDKNRIKLISYRIDKKLKTPLRLPYLKIKLYFLELV